MSYKTVRIAKYVMNGKESIVPMSVEKFREFVDNNPDFFWMEHLSEKFKNIQEIRDDGNPCFRLAFFYKPVPSYFESEMDGTFIEPYFVVIINVHRNYKQNLKKLEELADVLDANLYL